MTTTSKYILGLIIIILIGGGVYAYKTNQMMLGQNNLATTNGTDSTTKKIPFTDFVAQGKTAMCTVQQTIGNTPVEGTVYMDKGMLRGNFVATYNGQSITASFLDTNGFTYVWSSASPTVGYKLKDGADVKVNGITSKLSLTSYLQQVGDYTCNTWTPDVSVFAIPTTVTFKAAN